MDTIETDILRRLSRKGRGRIFFAQEFYDLYPESSVRYSLSNLVEEGQVLSEHGMRMLLPETDEIARAVAAKTRVRIAPYGDQAAYLVGLTGMQISSTTYITDGAPRKIRLSNGRSIEFRHTSEMRIFAFRNRKMQLLSNAIRALGRDQIGIEEKETIRWHLAGVSGEEFNADLQLCPEWVREILLDLKAN